MLKFFGRISENRRIETVKKAGKTYVVVIPEPKSVAHCTPARVAPNVFATVFAVRIADVVSSMRRINVSKSFPLLGESFFRFSISTGVVLSTMASRVEQKADTKRVKKIVRMSQIIIFLFSIFENLGFSQSFLLLCEFYCGMH